MVRKLIYLSLLTLVIVSCGTSYEKSENNKSEEIAQAVDVTVMNFESKAADLVGKPINITATVNHVCQHGGKRMFLVAEGSEESIKVVPCEKLASFNTDLQGYTVKVSGIIEELIIDEEYLIEWENELAEEAEVEKSEIEHTGEGHGEDSEGEEEEMDENAEALESIASYRQQIAESGTDHLSFYTIVCDDYEKLDKVEAKDETIEE